MLESAWELVLAGAGPGLQNQRAALCVAVGSTPTSFRHEIKRLSKILPADVTPTPDARFAASVAGLCVTVTGAGGDIGSALAMALAAAGPARLVLLESSEASLYRIDRQLEASYPCVARTAFVDSVTDDGLRAGLSPAAERACKPLHGKRTWGDTYERSISAGAWATMGRLLRDQISPGAGNGDVTVTWARPGGAACSTKGHVFTHRPAAGAMRRARTPSPAPASSSELRHDGNSARINLS